MNDDSPARARAVHVSAAATLTRPARRGQPWTAEANAWRAEGATERAAVDGLAGILAAFLADYRPPTVITFRGHTAVIWTDGTLGTWQQVITTPAGRQHTSTRGAADVGEATAHARYSLAHLATDWHDNTSVYGGAEFLRGGERYGYGQYGPAELLRYAAWQRAARAAMDAGRDDWHEWATTHADAYALPAPDQADAPADPAPDPAPFRSAWSL